jgi:annexin A7/11
MAQAIGRGSIVADPNFNAEKSAEELRKAMKGLGTDERRVINTLTACNAAQRQQIKVQFKTMYGKDLISDLKSELGGKLERVVLGLMDPVPVYNARCLRAAMKGAGTDEQDLIEILCTTTNEEVLAITEAYKKEIKRNLEKDVMSETSGHFKRLLVSVLQGNREAEGEVDAGKAKADAQALYDAGEGKFGTDESKFNQILAARSFSHLRVVFAEYKNISGHTMQKAIGREFSGDIEKGLLALVNCVENRPAYFARRLQQSMKGLGTNDDDLIRLCVSRAEVDMEDIKVEFQRQFKKTLQSYIKDDTSGDYEKILLAIVK